VNHQASFLRFIAAFPLGCRHWLARTLVAASLDRAVDASVSSRRSLRGRDPLENDSAGRWWEGVPVAACGWDRVKGGSEVVGFGEGFHVVEAVPGAAGFGVGDGAETSRLHEPSRRELFDALRVLRRPAARGLARGEEAGSAFGVDAAWAGVDPASGDRFIDDVVIANMGLARRLLPRNYPPPGAVSPCSVSHSRHWRRLVMCSCG